MKDLIPIAKKLSSYFHIPGMDFEDRVQECLISAWMHPQETKARSRTVMFRRLIKIAKRASPSHEEFNEEVHSPTWQVILIPKDDKTKEILNALVEANGFVADAAEILGMSKWQLYRRMKKIREEI